jgi:hypothetical protein
MYMRHDSVWKRPWILRRDADWRLSRKMMAPMGAKNAHAKTARTACMIRILSDMRRAGLKARSVTASPGPGLVLKLEDEATTGLATKSSAANSACNVFAISVRERVSEMSLEEE